MKPNIDSETPALPIYEPEDDVAYTLDVIATLSGVDSTTILRYQEQGLITQNYDAEALRRIRRIRHVETEYEAGPPTLRLILALYDEVESLRSLIRRH
jgi:hypothetical protein